MDGRVETGVGATSQDGEQLVEYRPKFAPHVVGTFEPSVLRSAPTNVFMKCETCHETITWRCASPRERVRKFALMHQHRDPMKTEPR